MMPSKALVIVTQKDSGDENPARLRSNVLSNTMKESQSEDDPKFDD